MEKICAGAGRESGSHAGSLAAGSARGAAPLGPSGMIRRVRWIGHRGPATHEERVVHEALVERDLSGEAAVTRHIADRFYWEDFEQAVDPEARTITVTELAEGGQMRTLRVRIPSHAAVVRSERLPDGQVRDPEHPFANRSIGIDDIRPGDFLVVELAKVGQEDVARSVTVTLEPAAK